MDNTRELKPEVIKYMVSSEFDNTVVTVGNKFSLNVNQIGNLIAVIKNYVYGNIRKEDLIGEISTMAEIDEDTVKKMLPDINSTILEPLKTRILVSFNYEPIPETNTANTNTNVPTQNPAPVITPQAEPQPSAITAQSSTTPKELPNPEEHGLMVVNSNLKESNVSTVKNTNYTVDPYRETIN